MKHVTPSFLPSFLPPIRYFYWWYSVSAPVEQLVTYLQQSGKQIWSRQIPRHNSVNNCRIVRVCYKSCRRSVQSSTRDDIPRQNTGSHTYTPQQHNLELWLRMNWPNLSRWQRRVWQNSVEPVDLLYRWNIRLVHKDPITMYLFRKVQIIISYRR